MLVAHAIKSFSDFPCTDLHPQGERIAFFNATGKLEVHNTITQSLLYETEFTMLYSTHTYNRCRWNPTNLTIALKHNNTLLRLIDTEKQASIQIDQNSEYKNEGITSFTKKVFHGHH